MVELGSIVVTRTTPVERVEVLLVQMDGSAISNAVM